MNAFSWNVLEQNRCGAVNFIEHIMPRWIECLEAYCYQVYQIVCLSVDMSENIYSACSFWHYDRFFCTMYKLIFCMHFQATLMLTTLWPWPWLCDPLNEVTGFYSHCTLKGFINHKCDENDLLRFLYFEHICCFVIFLE